MSFIIFGHDVTVILLGVVLLLSALLVAGLLFNRRVLVRRILSHTEALQKSESRLDKAEVAAGFGNWEYHLDDRHIVTSDGARRLFGLDESEWTMDEIMEIPLPEYHDMLNLAMKGLIQKYEPYDLEFRIRRVSDGEIRDIHAVAEYDAARNIVLGVIQDITDRKKVDRALKKSEARYRSILESMEEGYYEVNLDGDFTFFNSSAVRNLGYTDEEMVGMNFRQYTDEENARKIFEAYHKVFLTGEPINGFSWEFIDKGGKKLQVELSVSLKRNGEDRPIGFVGVVKDVTEKFTAQEALRRSEERHRSILDNMEEIYYELDLAGNILFFNSSTTRKTGYTSEELLGMNFSQYAHPEDMNKVIDVYTQVLKTGEPIKGFDWRIMGKDGSRIFVESSVSLMTDAAGKPKGFRGVTRDVTWRRRAEEELRRSEERYRTIFENTGTATMLSAEDTTILLANSNFEALTGYTKDEMEGRMSWTKLIDGEDLEMMIKYHHQRRTEPGTSPVTYEARCRTRNGELRHMYMSVAMIPDTSVSVISCLDLTDRKRAEEETKYREKLQAVLEMAGAVCHELNQPLQVITSASELLLTDETACDMDHELLGSIQEGVEKIGSLTQKIMKIAGYEVKEYLGGKGRIIDIEKSSSGDD